MKTYLQGFIILFAITFSEGIFSANAAAQEITEDPVCFVVRNEAPYSIRGSIVTDYYVRPDGVKARHRSNFRLEEFGTVQDETGYPLDAAEFCSYGPFYPDRKLDLVLRTLVPIFSCRTSVEQGDIIIQGHKKPEGGTDTKALCFE